MAHHCYLLSGLFIPDGRPMPQDGSKRVPRSPQRPPKAPSPRRAPAAFLRCDYALSLAPPSAEVNGTREVGEKQRTPLSLQARCSNRRPFARRLVKP
eukprot:4456910-Pyramimonas_sp.AAC.1